MRTLLTIWLVSVPTESYVRQLIFSTVTLRGTSGRPCQLVGTGRTPPVAEAPPSRSSWSPGRISYRRGRSPSCAGLAPPGPAPPRPGPRPAGSLPSCSCYKASLSVQWDRLYTNCIFLNEYLNYCHITGGCGLSGVYYKTYRITKTVS